MKDLCWYWHKCYVRDHEGEKYYMATMGEYQMIVTEAWFYGSLKNKEELHWRPRIAKWSEEESIFIELQAADVGVSLELHKDLTEAMEFLQKWYTIHIHADKLILGEESENSGSSFINGFNIRVR